VLTGEKQPTSTINSSKDKPQTPATLVNKRQLLEMFCLAPLAALVGCKDILPSTPTIIRGKIIDGNGNPLEGAGLGFSGANLKGFSGYNTFAITTETDQNGIYELSQITTQDIEKIHILPRTTDKVPLDEGFGGYVHYIFIDGRYIALGAPYDIPRSSWGKTITLNYQFIKK
jgi:hypothetical protein